ncbi:hypothetical protein D043_0782B, partial [Vibrio parahaemolyticus EKP-021]
NRHRKRHS